MDRLRIKGDRRRPGALLAAMTCLASVLLILGVAQSRRVSALTLQVNAAYQKALYESVELMDSVQLNLEKLLASGDRAQQQMLLATIAQQCEGLQDDLASMPLDPELLDGTMKFVNQTGDYARVLAERLGGGLALLESDVRQLMALYDASVDLNASLADMVSRFERGEIVFEPRDSAVAVTRGLEDEKEPLAQYPELLYDGPFSDARREGAVALSGPEVNSAQAEQLLAQFVGADRVQSVRYSGESDILGKCFEYEVQTADGVLDASVTQRGGHVLYILPEYSPTETALSQGECIDMAYRFLGSRGYAGMEVTYWRQYDGTLTVIFVATQDGVLLYPDMIKLQVSMKDGSVIGVDAEGYLRNHIRRDLIVPAFTSEQALGALGAALAPDRIRQCVIPIDSGEAQCWEIGATGNNANQYLVYIDVMTGEERNILRIMAEDGGVLAQ